MFDQKKLRLSNKNIEKRLRKVLAERYIEITSKQVFDESLKLMNSWNFKVSAFFNKFKVAFITLGIVGVFAAPTIIDGLTSVETLTRRIHEKSKRDFNGALCNDGKISSSQGRGTCSWHHGVKRYFYEGEYTKTIVQCRKEATELSWRE